MTVSAHDFNISIFFFIFRIRIFTILVLSSFIAMVNFEKLKLDNGLTVILHQDRDSTLAAVNVLYKIGSKNEPESQTGITHLFEHMMFTGTESIPDIDTFLQNAGGENNAFTNADYTNYYSYAPLSNLELLLAIEADRMSRLKLKKEKFNIQKNVVIEEFYETSLNQPYGDVWHLISQLAYKEHHYRWPTIGKTPEHIQEITYESIKNFYDFYCPNNAILAIGGNINIEKVKDLVKKYFADIPPKTFDKLIPPPEPVQTHARKITIERNVPSSALYIGFHIPERVHNDFYALDMITDFYTNNESSFLYKTLVKKKSIFSSIDAWVVGSIDPGLLLIEGKLEEGLDYDTATESIKEAIDEGVSELTDQKLEKIKNKIKTNLILSEVNMLNKVISLAYFEMLDNIDLINTEGKIYNEMEKSELLRVTSQYLDFSKANILEYSAVSA